jgi:hypothetical protein
VTLHWIERWGAGGEIVSVDGYRTSRSHRPVASAVLTLHGWRPELSCRWVGRAGLTREQAIAACEAAL